MEKQTEIKSKEEILREHLLKYYRKDFPFSISDDELYGKIRVFHEEEKAILAAMEEYRNQTEPSEGDYVTFEDLAITASEMEWPDEIMDIIKKLVRKPLPEGKAVEVWVEKDAVKEPPKNDSGYFVTMKDEEGNTMKDFIHYEKGRWLSKPSPNTKVVSYLIKIIN